MTIIPSLNILLCCRHNLEKVELAAVIVCLLKKENDDILFMVP